MIPQEAVPLVGFSLKGVYMNKKTVLFLLSFCTVFLWASAFPVTKIVQEQFTSNTLGFLRCTFASIFLIIIGKCNHIRFPQKQDIPWFFLSGCVGFSLYMIVLNTGISTLTSATSSIIMATTPILTAIVATKLYQEHIKKIGWIAIFTAFLGVLILLLWDGIFSVNIGMFYMFLAAVLFCSYNIITRHLATKGYQALEIVTYSMISGSILLGFCSIQSVELLLTSDIKYVLALVYLGAFPSALAYFLWGKAMSFAEKTSEVTNFMFVTPLLSTILGFLILHEVPNMGTFLGGAIIICSIVVFNLKGK